MQQKPVGTMEKIDLFKKIEYTEILYEGKSTELGNTLKDILKEEGIEKRLITYEEELKELDKEAGWFSKYTNFFGKYKPEFNKKLKKIEEKLGTKTLMKTRKIKERINGVVIVNTIIEYGMGLGFGMSVVSSPLPLAILVGLGVGFGLELVTNSSSRVRYYNKARERAQKLDKLNEKYN